MTVNGSKVVEFPFEVPRMMVNNPDVIRVSPISSTSIQISAMRAGVTQVISQRLRDVSTEGAPILPETADVAAETAA